MRVAEYAIRVGKYAKMLSTELLEVKAKSERSVALALPRATMFVVFPGFEWKARHS
jgi:hypothetical protein